jgi:uncharacterized protein
MSRVVGVPRCSGLLVVLGVFCHAGCDAPPSATALPPALQLTNTAVYQLPAKQLNRQYQVWVDVPASYVSSNKSFPILFVTDAPYSFPLVRSIRNLLGQKGRNIDDFILVGLPYADGDAPAAARSRDYTPTVPAAGSQYSAAAYGEAARYRDYLEYEVFAFIEQRYRVDSKRRIFAGHSFGALFGAYVLLTKPELFYGYILSSPSLWFDNKAIMDFESDYARRHGDLPAKVAMYAGSYETVAEGPRFFRSVDLLGDLRRFERALRARGYKSLEIGVRTIDEEDHLTVFPAAISRGLLQILPGHGPYTSG